MNAIALADETDTVCSFIFKKRWAVNNLDKICGQQALLTLRRIRLSPVSDYYLPDRIWWCVVVYERPWKKPVTVY